MNKAKPFVKWVGGKRAIMESLKKYIPKEYNTYYEVFIGGGALLLDLSPKNAVINDYNAELINVYRCLKDKRKLALICDELDKHELNHCEEYFYTVRALDRNKESFDKLEDYVKASRTIYLNKACFNGKYSVNKRNEFNSSFGKKLKVNTYNRDNLYLINEYLNTNNITILNTDFENALTSTKKGDFIYLDPPYDTDTTIFASYTDKGFGKEEQIRLSKVLKDLDKRGCYVMLSNYNTQLINELYKDFNIHIINGKTCLCGNTNGRGFREELIITNY